MAYLLNREMLRGQTWKKVLRHIRVMLILLHQSLEELASEMPSHIQHMNRYGTGSPSDDRTRIYVFDRVSV